LAVERAVAPTGGLRISLFANTEAVYSWNKLRWYSIKNSHPVATLVENKRTRLEYGKGSRLA
jgi:hypothetical protein